MLRAPATVRETIGLFANLREGQSAEELFARVDWAGASARQLIHAFLDRPPADAEEAAQGEGVDPATFALALFQSGAFRHHLPGRILRHYPGKQRLLFVHIPKAAGTDFAAAMNRTHPPLSEQLSDAELVPPLALARRLRQFARLVGEASSIFVAGHTRLSTYLDGGYFRFNDRVMAIVRDPNEICLSFANYVLARFAADPGLTAQDTRAWAASLGMTATEIAAIEPRALGLAIVTRPGFQTENPICSLLGDGTARGTVDNLQRAAVEITTSALYSGWLKQRWNIDRAARSNASRQVIGWDDLSAVQKSRIAERNEEDFVVYGAVLAALGGRISVTGPEIAASARMGSGSARPCP